MAFAVSCTDSGSNDPTGDDTMGDTQHAVCGDAMCEATEVGFCAADCGTGGNSNAVCGNAMCETSKGENQSTCFSDCGTGSGSGSGSGSSTSCPTDQTFLILCALCSADASLCMAPADAATCAACGGGGLGSGGGLGDIGCEGMVADGTCNAAAGEDATTCPSDCP